MPLLSGHLSHVEGPNQDDLIVQDLICLSYLPKKKQAPFKKACQ